MPGLLARPLALCRLAPARNAFLQADDEHEKGRHEQHRQQGSRHHAAEHAAADRMLPTIRDRTSRSRLTFETSQLRSRPNVRPDTKAEDRARPAAQLGHAGWPVRRRGRRAQSGADAFQSALPGRWAAAAAAGAGAGAAREGARSMAASCCWRAIWIITCWIALANCGWRSNRLKARDKKSPLFLEAVIMYIDLYQASVIGRNLVIQIWS